MREEVISFFSSIQSDFIAGRLEAAAQHLAKPLIVYSPAGVVVVQSVQDIVHRTTMYRDALLALSTANGNFEILSQDTVVNNRLRVTLRSTYSTATGEETSSSVSRYFLVQTDQAYVIEMIEYLEFPLPLGDV